MDRYKFRAKAIEPMADGNQWIDDGFGVHYIELADGGVECVLYTPHGHYHVDQATVGQYSIVNLKDDTELYAGDIVQHVTAKWIGTLIFDDGAFRVKSNHGTWVLDKLRAERLVKLGTVHDNPDLLEG